MAPPLFVAMLSFVLNLLSDARVPAALIPVWLGEGGFLPTIP